MLSKLMGFIKSNDLHLWVFTTGAIVLVIEIVAVRILAPYFGNTLFSFSSVLSVVLLALSAGYWYGGNWADRRPERNVFYSIIVASGVLLLAIELVRETILDRLSDWFTISSGPLVAALVLFIGPAFLLGMLSPFAIKLRSEENKKLGVGRVAGGMFFWSTLGSISGSIAAGFFLIPAFGVDAIMLAVGLILVAIGGVPLVIRSGLSRAQASRLAMIVLALTIGIVSSRTALASDVLYQSHGVYERIRVTEGTLDDKPAHFLWQDSSISGAAFVESDELAFDYAKYYSVFELFDTDLERTLVLGGGTYSIPRSLLGEPSSPIVDAVEIEPSLLDVSHDYFGLPRSDRLNNYVEDGRFFLRNSEHTYSLIYGDVYKSLFSIPSHFTTVEFFELARSSLTDDGVFVMNIIADLYIDGDSLALSEIRTFQSVFPDSHFYAVVSPEESGNQNIILVGTKKDEPTEIDYDRFKGSDNDVLASLSSKEIDVSKFDLSDQLILTDDYAPIDFMVAALLAQD